MDRSNPLRAVFSAILPALVFVLVAIGPCCCAAEIDVVRNALRDDSSNVTASALDRLVRAIEAKDIAATEAALKTIRGLAAEKAAVAATEKLLSSDDIDIRCLAADVVCQFDTGKAASLLSAFENGLKSKAPRIRARGALGLAQIGPAARQAIPALLQATSDENFRVRAAAAKALGCIGSAATEAVPALENLLRDQALPVRAFAVRSLSQIGSPSKAAVPGLLSALQQPESSELRQAAAKALGGIGPDAVAAVPALIARLKDDDVNVRVETLKTLRTIGPQAKEATAALISSLKDSNADVQRMAAMALGKIGRDADSAAALAAILNEDNEGNANMRVVAAYSLAAMGSPANAAIPALVAALHDRSAEVRSAAINAIVTLAISGEGVDVHAAVPHLLQWLDDSNLSVRRQAVSALVAIGIETEKAAPRLKSGLKSSELPERRWAAETLGQIPAAAKASVPELIAATNRDPDARVQQCALKALAGAGLQAGVRIDRLVAILNNSMPEADVLLRTWAAGSLGVVGPAAKEAIPALSAAMRDKTLSVRAAAAYSLVILGRTGCSPVTAEFRKRLDDVEQDVCLTSACALGWDAFYQLVDQKIDALDDMKTSLAALERTKARFTLDARGEQEWSAPIDSVKKAIVGLEAAGRAQLIDRALKEPRFLVAAGISLAVAVLLAVWFVLYWLHPLVLLRIDDAMRPFGEITLPSWLGGIKSTLPKLLLVRCFSYRNRVLDAWVALHLPAACENFGNRGTVRERVIHVPSPLVVDGKPLACPGPEHLDAAFARKRTCLLIHGEGGAGKTSLACQIARWAMGTGPGCSDSGKPLAPYAMIPVLIEHDLDARPMEANDAFSLFTETIRGQVQVLIGERETLSDELLRALLLRGRILVIVDHFSEMSDETRNAIRPGLAGFPASALVVTSRREETLDDVPKILIRPLRIEGDRLASFMESYLLHRGKRDLFDDSRFFDVCRGLSCMVGAKKTSVLLAKLYAEATICSAEGTASEGLPDTIPDLVLAHVNELHRNVAADRRRDSLSVRKDAELLAWESLEQSLHPTSVPVKTAIAVLGGDDAAERLEYLEKHLGLIRINQPGCDSISFVLDPLAEYLAALWLVEKCREKDQHWDQFLSRVSKLASSSQNDHGFLRATIDCCRARQVGDDLIGMLAGATNDEIRSPLNLVTLEETEKDQAA